MTTPIQSNAVLISSDPQRPPAWRWLRALRIRQRQQRVAPEDHNLVPVLRFLQRLSLATSDVALERLAQQAPGLMWAYRVYTDGSQALRAEVEARILAKQSPREVAEAVGVPTRSVQLYEWLFFHVRDRLHVKAYILHTVLGEQLHRNLNERDYGMIWRYYAYLHGPAVLESLIQQAVTDARPQDITETKAFWYDDRTGNLVRKTAMAARTVPINQFTQIELLHVAAKFEEARALGGGGTNADNDANVSATIDAIMVSMPITMRKPGMMTAPVDGDPLAQYDNGGAELNSKQLMRLMQREYVPELQLMDGLEYPEPTNHAQIESASGTGDPGSNG